MKTRLIDKNWGDELAALAKNSSSLRIICPFIKTKGLEYLHIERQEKIQVITRFNEHDFFNGVSDIAALHQLLESGAEIRGVRGLHSKVYLFGETHAVVTSANLTQSAMTSNHEFGVISEDAEIIGECHEYFDGLWERAGDNLTHEKLDESGEAVQNEKKENKGPHKSTNLKDNGSDARQNSNKAVTANDSEGPQAFVKFLGSSDNRVPLSCTSIEEMQRSGCHWALGYPTTRRPTGVKEGAVMFIARMVEPNGIQVFGRAVGIKHVPGRDEATDEETVLRDDGQGKWTNYIRIKQVEFLNGAMMNGVSLYEMMEHLQYESFASTLRNYNDGSDGNIDPRRAYSQQPAVELAPEGRAWLEKRLQTAFSEHGKLTEVDLRKIEDLYWPNIKFD